VNKLLYWLAIVIFAIWLLKNPGQAAALAHQIGHAISTLAGAL
jgi:flagellar biogenesis protein FliO